MKLRFSLGSLALLWLSLMSTYAKPVQHFVFFGHEREKIKELPFLETSTLTGAQIRYSWRQLEPEKDKYDFSAIQEDLAFLRAKGKKLFIQLQDVTFSEKWIAVPRYLMDEPRYNGGAVRQYEYPENDETRATPAGWAARRWDPAVQERLHSLFTALGKAFDGKIAGINLAESSIDFGESGRLFPSGFTSEIYRDALIANMRALKKAFSQSVVMQYANFMPGEWLPEKDKGHLRAVYRAAQESNIGVGGPDLLPYKRGQLNHAYPLIKAAAGKVVTGIAVQDGNYEHVTPYTKQRVTMAELYSFAISELKVDYVFWCIEEPYYSKQVIPFFRNTNNLND